MMYFVEQFKHICTAGYDTLCLTAIASEVSLALEMLKG
jgi:hypothetical protein